MTKTKTVLAAFAALALAGNAYSQLRPKGLPRRSTAEAPSSAVKEEGQSGIPGVTAPFVPFDEKDKIKYEDAVERAKKNDPEAFYWLTYYFLNGDGVVQNWNAAGKFLQKAVDLGNAKACYLLGLYHNEYSLTHEHSGNSSTKGPIPVEANDILIEAGINGRIASLQIPKPKTNDPQKGNHVQIPNRLLNLNNRHNRGCCFTNEVMTGYVIGLFTSAAKGGLVYATNDIVRLKRTIDCCRKCIVSEVKAQKALVESQKKIQAKSAAALDLLDETREEEKKRKQGERYDQWSAYWSSWPTTLSSEERTRLLCETERKYNVIISGDGTFDGTTNTWHRGEGKSLIIITDDLYRKIDQDGLMVACGSLHHFTELDEIKWYDAEVKKRLASLQKGWAEEHGMTLEESIRKHKEWASSRPTGPRLLNLNNRPGFNSLRRPGLARSPRPASGPGLVQSQRPTGLEIARARRQGRIDRQNAEAEQRRQAAEQAKKMREQERKERELAAEERRAQLEQLMQIQEELRRQREERAKRERREHENGRP